MSLCLLFVFQGDYNMTPDRHLGYVSSSKKSLCPTYNPRTTNILLCETRGYLCVLSLPTRSAWIDKCQPDLMITESTYATTIRDSKR